MAFVCIRVTFFLSPQVCCWRFFTKERLEEWAFSPSLLFFFYIRFRRNDYIFILLLYSFIFLRVERVFSRVNFSPYAFTCYLLPFFFL